jgi:hypothetical protein
MITDKQELGSRATLPDTLTMVRKFQNPLKAEIHVNNI